MHARDAVFLEDLCPKLRVRRWRQSLHSMTHKTCIYCGKPSESIDHLLPQSRGGLSITENCVPACLVCNGHKSDADAFEWYRRQRFYDPRRAMAIRAWMDGDLRLAMRLLQWAAPRHNGPTSDPPTKTTSPDRRRRAPALTPAPLIWQAA
ncbi:MAG: HNH endonuclease [Vulcanococcus sp.]